MYNCGLHIRILIGFVKVTERQRQRIGAAFRGLGRVACFSLQPGFHIGRGLVDDCALARDVFVSCKDSTRMNNAG